MWVGERRDFCNQGKGFRNKVKGGGQECPPYTFYHRGNVVNLEPAQLIFRMGVSIRMNNTFTKSLLVLAVGGLMFAGSASAQTSTSTSGSTSGAGPGVVDPGHPRVNEVNKREENQQQRIGNGVSGGKLTSQQTTNLEKRETNVQNREQKDMAKNNGHLTKAEQKGINRQQNRISKSIYKDKHE
jgi:hypothetical protein